MTRNFFLPTLLLMMLFVSCSGGGDSKKVLASSAKYEDLVTLFKEWRVFQQPLLVNGVPDYSPDAMKKQHADLVSWQARLNNIDTAGWPISQQVDWYLVWAEMNGLDFDQKVIRPWEKDPAFYVWFFPEPSDVPEREGPNVSGAIELPAYSMPLSEADAAVISAKLRLAPALYDRAKKNLTGNGKDLWTLSVRSFRQQSKDLAVFGESVGKEHPDLAAAAAIARKASDDFAAWITTEVPGKTALSGIGKENFTWYIRNVHLMPYDWEGYKQLLERELMRSHAALRLTEYRNRSIPPLEKINNDVKFDTVMRRGVKEFMQFLGSGVMTVKDYMEPAMMAQIGKFTKVDGMRNFFAEVDYRDPMPMRSHHFHWIDKATSKLEPVSSVIRQQPTLYNIFDSRAEGLATAMEELMWQGGLYKGRPRGEELVWIMLAERAARGLGGLYQHGQVMSFDQATKYASTWVPRGLLPADGETIQWEEHFYLQQPGYETSYVSGKILIDQLIAEYARQREGKFEMQLFMDEFLGKGIIPVSLIYWEMTGDKSMLERSIRY
jgi:hypothetical protein